MTNQHDAQRSARREQRRERRADRERRRRERSKRPRRHRDDGAGDDPTRSASASEDWESYEDRSAEDAIAEGRKLARAKARLAREVVEFVIVVGVLAMFWRTVAAIVGLIWGLDLASKFAKRIVEPSLRRRWVDREVSRRLGRQVPDKRRQIEGEHDRRIEELAAGVAHEIRNPITAAKSLVQQMGEDPAAGENVGYAQIALDELNRVEKSISHLLRFARDQELHAQEMRIVDVIESAVATLQDRFDQADARVVTAVDAEGMMRGDAEQLRRVLINLLANSLEALERAEVEKPRIEIEAGENLARTEVWLRVRDNGPGIDPDRLSRIFSPFYTSKQDGTGLGLAISKKVVDAHGGSIEAQSEPGRGTSFVITLPKAAGRAE